MLWFCRDLCSFGGEGVVILSWVYVHSSICETYLLLKWFQRFMLEWRKRWSQSAMGICAFFYISNLFGVVVFQRSIFEWRSGCSQSAMCISVLFYM